MLWSLIKVVLFFCVIAFLAWGAGQLMSADGALRVSFANTEFTLGPLQTVIAAILLILVVWIVIKLLGLLVAVLRFLNGDETAVSRHFSRSRERKGLNALSDAMLALASGEGKEARSKAERAEKYLNRPDLTRLLVAQGAEMTGDRSTAEGVYKELLTDDRTRFVGVRGLMKQRLEDGDTDTAMALAEKAFALKPKHVETQDTLLRLQAGKHDWTGARRTLGAKLKHGSMPRDVHKRRDAVLALSEARDLLAADSDIKARENAIEANRLSPDLIPAAVLASREYIRNNQTRYATRVIKKAWEAQPHPDLAAAFAEIAPDETPEQRVRRFHTLTRLKPDHPETRMLLAELHIANEDFPAARRALGDLATAHPTARSVTIMAAIERGEGADDAVVRGWLARAVSVPRGPQWVCDNCHSVHSGWEPICGNCGAFDTLSWREPREGMVAMPVQAEMLPLIVGREEGHAEVAMPEKEQTALSSDVPPAPGHPDPAPSVATADVSEGDAEKTSGEPVPPVSEDRTPTATSVPEAEVIVPQEQRDEENAKRN
ncbi:heme biosynthesis protein HemY [Palleronia sp. LCG004]|uniref:heme biosynthesis protein HemY n=1 Tax=Palleronia sp. LCG004 TaxID=3079304 RepID=UPI002943D859|nr:heme biosynthesis HemY N-terminal domain-containing protein [Palleronia sp. LCG004]WOI55909.1 heme biosynthesis HemY N-terminal domain-containing protein [Palleronia sp. LCG004]